jgi:nucleotide-binding universal stress UspA family protein
MSGPLDLRRVLVPLDFSALSEQALPHAKALAAKFGGKITLVHVIESGRMLAGFSRLPSRSNILDPQAFTSWLSFPDAVPRRLGRVCLRLNRLRERQEAGRICQIAGSQVSKIRRILGGFTGIKPCRKIITPIRT